MVLRIEHEVGSPRLARRALAPMLGDADDLLRDRVETVVSELVSNVVQHTNGSGVLRVWGPRPDEPLRLEVSDKALGHLVSPAHPTDAGGRGLRIVAAMADAWGINFDSGGKHIWAEFSRPDA